MSKSLISSVTKILFIAALYYVLGRVGLSISVVKVAPVWPAAGVALAAVLIWGYRIWPGIWIGAFSINLWSTLDPAHPINSALLSIITATSTTLGSLLANYLLTRYANGGRCLDRVHGAVLFLVFGAVVNTSIAATG